MNIASIEPLTLLDYPGKLAAIFFLNGCNMRCGYCHNPELVLPTSQAHITEETYRNFLRKRQGMLEGIVVCGGEPTIHQALPFLLEEIHTLGFATKLDTNGTNTHMLQSLLDAKLVDYVAMDIKGTPEIYASLCKTRPALMKEVLKSIQIIMSSAPEYEFRTTLIPSFHNGATLHAMGAMISGAKKWVLQNFRSHTTLDPTFSTIRSWTRAELEYFQQIAQNYVEVVDIRY